MKRHQMDPVSLVAGLVFAAVAGVYLIATQTDTNVDGRWVLPLALIGLGVGGVLGAVNSAARQRISRVDEPTVADDDELTELSESVEAHRDH